MGSGRVVGQLALLLVAGLIADCSSHPTVARCAGQQACGGLADDAGSAAVASATGDVESAAAEATAAAVSPEATSSSTGEALGLRFCTTDGAPIDVLVLACSGCVDVEAVAYGGNPPYAFEWDDGSTRAVRRVCDPTSADLSVRVTDAPIAAEEFGYAGSAVSGTIEARAVECADDGSCGLGPGRDTPEPGRYDGTGSYVCDNDANAESAALVNHLTLSVNLEIDATAEKQRGHAYVQWGLVVIAGEGQLDGRLECGGAVRATFEDATWGVPGADPMTVIPTGTIEGELTARASAEVGTITGTWTWTSMSAAGDYGNTCNGTYEAHLVAP